MTIAEKYELLTNENKKIIKKEIERLIACQSSDR